MLLLDNFWMLWGAFLVLLGGHSATSWGLPGASWSLLGASWGLLGRSSNSGPNLIRVWLAKGCQQGAQREPKGCQNEGQNGQTSKTNFDIEKCRAAAHSQFRILDEHLYFQEQLGNSWVCEGESPTIADIACFPYVVLSEEGGVSRITYPAIRRWIDRFKRIDGFVIMPGMFPAGPGH